MNNTTTVVLDPYAVIADHFLPIVIIRVIFTLIGAFGNSLVLFIIVNKKKQKTNNDILLFNLATADLLYIVFADVRYFYANLDKTPKSLFYCKVVNPVLSIPYSVGIFTITIMAIQRCRVILNPLRPKGRMCYTYLSVAATWFLSGLVVLPASIFAVNAGGHCPLQKYGWNEHANFIYFIAVSVIQYPIPLSVIIFAYVRIGIYMSKPRVPRLSVISKGNKLRSPSDETRKESIQITKTVGVIVLLFAILMLPLQIAMITAMLFKNRSPWVYILWDYSDVLGTVNSCLDPFVYSARTKQYRELIAKWMAWFCPWFAVKKRRSGSKSSRHDRCVFPTRDEQCFTNDEVLRTVDEISIDFPENKPSKLSFSFKNGDRKRTENPC